MASSFKRWVTRGGTTLTYKTLTEGAVDEHGDPTQSWATSTLHGHVSTIRRELVQKEQGLLTHYTVVVKVPVDAVIHERDHVVISSVEYEVGPPETRDSHILFTAWRLVG